MPIQPMCWYYWTMLSTAQLEKRFPNLIRGSHHVQLVDATSWRQLLRRLFFFSVRSVSFRPFFKTLPQFRQGPAWSQGYSEGIFPGWSIFDTRLHYDDLWCSFSLKMSISRMLCLVLPILGGESIMLFGQGMHWYLSPTLPSKILQARRHRDLWERLRGPRAHFGSSIFSAWSAEGCSWQAIDAWLCRGLQGATGGFKMGGNR